MSLIPFLTLRNPLLARLQALAPGDRSRAENVLAVARAFLAVSSLIAIWIDATEPSRYASMAYGLMLSYAVYSLVILAWIRRRSEFSLPFLIALQGIDVFWPVVISVFTGPTSSPFLIFNAFVQLEAAYRWGLLETLATGAVQVLSYSLVSTVAVYGPAAFRLLDTGEPNLNRMIIRPLYLAIMAYLLGYLGEQEKFQRAEASGIARLIGRVQAELGLRGAMRGVFDGALQVFGSNRTLLILNERSTGRTYVWEGMRQSSDAPLSVDWSEPNLSAGTSLSFDPPGTVWFARKNRPGSSPAGYSVEALLDEKAGYREVAWSPPGPLLEAYPFEFALGAAVSAGTEWSGSWWLLDPDCHARPQRAAGFLRAMAQQLFPAIHGVFVMRRLRTQAGAVERARVARELHDGVIQSLIGLEMQMDVLRRKTESLPPDLATQLARLQSLLHGEVLNLRELMQQMKPVEYSPRQFLDFLAQMVDKFRRDTGIEAHFVSSEGEVELASKVGSEVARILQEALVNIRKHSGARNVLVRFDAQDGLWKLAIDDDGHGFDFSGNLSQDELDRARKGPVLIKERVRSIGGELRVESVQGRGSRLVITFPQDTHGK